MNCPLCDAVCAESAEKCDCGYIFKVEQNNQKRTTSIQRYVLNVIVRTLFFFGLSPVFYLLNANDISFTDYLISAYQNNQNIYLLLPYGLIIFIVFGIIGSVLDIILPKKYLIGGKTAIWAFNFSTLTWFEGIEFSVSVNTGFGGKGVSIKEERE